MTLRLVLLVVFTYILHSIVKASSYGFSGDYLTPYSWVRHGSRRISREIAECQHVRWENKTFEEFISPPLVPTPPTARYELHRFADVVSDEKSDLSRRYLVGSIAYLNQPYYTFSVLEPSQPGGCKVNYWSSTRSSVRETAAHRVGGCRVAANAGYFNVHSGRCLGNVVSDGRVVQTSNDEQNANFGIRQDGTIVVGYIPDQEILNTSNPFRQLVSGVIWLVRNGSSFVNESMQLECSSHEDTGRMETFVKVISARTAIGHDTQGRLVIAQVNGQTHHRGANLYEFADLLAQRGVVNAINLDGGGSSTLLENQVLINYPSDHCPGSPEYRCERQVSTAICIHDVQCIEPECNGHGSCDLGVCSCDSSWIGEGCDQLNCSLTDCSHHGNCVDGQCSCSSGWTGDFCNESCPTGRYGPNCGLTCYCYGRSICDPVSGVCTCPDGYHGYGCWQECDVGFYGSDCHYQCNCSQHGRCSPVNGSCFCEDGWEGTACNDPAVTTVSDSLGSHDVTSDERNSTQHPTVITEGPGSNLVHLQQPPALQDPSLDHQSTSIPTCQKPSYSLTSAAVAMVIGAGFISVLVHILICWGCQKRHNFENHQRIRHSNRTGLKRRRRLRKRPAFMQVPIQSSSDCSI